MAARASNPKRVKSLINFINHLSPEHREVFAEEVGVSLGGLLQIAYGNRPCPLNYAIRVDKITKGYVTVLDLVPNVDWEALARSLPERLEQAKQKTSEHSDSEHIYAASSFELTRATHIGERVPTKESFYQLGDKWLSPAREEWLIVNVTPDGFATLSRDDYEMVAPVSVRNGWTLLKRGSTE